MSAPDLRAVVRDVLASSELCDPRDIAEEVAARIRPDDRFAALRQALEPYVRVMLSQERRFPTSPEPARYAGEPGGQGATHAAPASGVDGSGPPTTIMRPTPRQDTSLADPLLYFLATLVGDLESQRTATANRLEVLTRTGADKDGVVRGFGLPDDHPTVLLTRSIVTSLTEQEKLAVKVLEKAMKKHPLGPWILAQKGIGLKQGARFLAATGDPYWNTLHDRPRTVSELWAYCGLHVADTGAAVRRTKGQKSNWSTEAKTRAYLIAEKCMMTVGGEYRQVYLDRRKHTAITHPDWPKGHSHNDALRIVSKRVLRDVWREARRLHLEEAEL